VRRPLLHFVLIGALLFVGVRLLRRVEAEPEAAVSVLRVSAAQREQIRRDALATLGRPASPEELDAFVAAAVDDELLLREARRLGLDEHDVVVRRRLVQNMRFLRGEEPGDDDALYAEPGDDDALYAEALALGMDESDPVVRRRLIQRMRLAIEAQAGADDPSDAELLEYRSRHLERFTSPDRVRFTQVFFDPARRAEAAQTDAAALLARLDDAAPAAARPQPRGDPFPAAGSQALQSEREISKLFGPEFASSLMGLPEGRWRGPLRSAHGFHLVRVEERRAGAVQDLDSIRSALHHGVQAERRQRALARALVALRARYAVQVEQALVP